jgi:hypothetical protein
MFFDFFFIIVHYLFSMTRDTDTLYLNSKFNYNYLTWLIL